MPIAKSVKRQVRSTESSHIVNTTIRLSHNAVPGSQRKPNSETYGNRRGKEGQAREDPGTIGGVQGGRRSDGSKLFEGYEPPS